MRIPSARLPGRLVAAALLAAVLLAGCGEPSAPEQPKAPPEPPGAYALDVEDWQQRAEAGGGHARWADVINQSMGSDPTFLPSGQVAPISDRPARPKEWKAMDEAEKRAFHDRTMAYVRAEAEALDEKFLLSADGSFEHTHRSRCAKGGSISFGLMGRHLSRGTWTRDGDTITLHITEGGVPDGKTWACDVNLTGELRPDGSIEFEQTRDAFRSQESVFRPE